MIDLSNVIGSYNPYIDGWLDPDYIVRAALLCICMWGFIIMLINILKIIGRSK